MATKSYTYEIKQDYDAESPWEGDAAGVFQFLSNNTREIASVNTKYTARHYTDRAESFKALMREWRKDLPGAGWSLYPVRAYIHSGIALSLDTSGQFGDRWDSGWIGIMAINPLTMGHKKGKANFMAPKIAQWFIDVMNQYLRGDVWGYVVRDEEGDIADSVWGIYGHEEAEKEAKEFVTWRLAEDAKNDAETSKVVAL